MHIMQTYFILTYNVVSVTGNGKRAGRPSSTLLLRVMSHLRRLCSPQRRPGNRVRREARFRGLKCHLRLATGLPATGLPRDSRLLRPRGETRARGRSERAHAMPSAPTAFRKMNERAGVDLGPDAAEAAGERPPTPHPPSQKGPKACTRRTDGRGVGVQLVPSCRHVRESVFLVFKLKHLTYDSKRHVLG